MGSSNGRTSPPWPVTEVQASQIQTRAMEATDSQTAIAPAAPMECEDSHRATSRPAEPTTIRIGRTRISQHVARPVLARPRELGETLNNSRRAREDEPAADADRPREGRHYRGPPGHFHSLLTANLRGAPAYTA